MNYELCIFSNISHCITHYAEMGYAVDVIKEILNITDTLNGKQQLCLIRRASNGVEKVFIVYNYVYKDNETIGLCFAFNDVYPQNVKYLFTFCGQVLSKIVNEGKVLYFDEFGFLHSNMGDGKNFSSLYKKHLAEARSIFEPKKGNFTQVPPTYFSNYKNQHAIFQLSDQSWTMSEALLYNNIVIITEEIEEENINSMRSFIMKSNETVDDLNRRIKKLEEQLKQAEREKRKQSQTNPPKEQSNNSTDSGTDVTMWIVVGVIGAIILLNVIAPWFIPSVWPKLAVVFTVLGTYVVIKALDDDSNKKIYEILGWSGAVAILLSTVLTIYGLCGGFSQDTVDEDSNIKMVTENSIVQESEGEELVSNLTPIARIPNNFILVPSGMLRHYFDHYDNNYNAVYKDWAVDSFYICKYEVIQKDYESVMGTNPSKYIGDSLPVHNISNFEAVLFCNKKSEKEGYDGFYEIDSSARVKLKPNGNGYRLPTDHEWALAARSGERKTTKYAAGNNLKEIAWYGGNSGNKPHKVGTKQPNGRGLYDMNGNVLELCLFDDGKVWGKGSSYNLYISFDEETGMGYGGTLSSKQSQGEDMGMRLVFIPNR